MSSHMVTRRQRQRQQRQQKGGAAAHFNYTSAQSHEDIVNGRKEAHMKIVEIKNGEGVKRVINIDPSGKKKTHTAKLNRAEVSAIRRKIFIPNLFAPLMRMAGMLGNSSMSRISRARNTTRHKKTHRK